MIKLVFSLLPLWLIDASRTKTTGLNLFCFLHVTHCKGKKHMFFLLDWLWNRRSWSLAHRGPLHGRRHQGLTAFLCNFPGEPQLWDFVSRPMCSKAVCQSGVLLTAETQLCLSNVSSLEQTALARLLAILQSRVGGRGNQGRLEGVADVIFAPERLTSLSARPSPAFAGSWNTLGAATGETASAGLVEGAYNWKSLCRVCTGSLTLYFGNCSYTVLEDVVADVFKGCARPGVNVGHMSMCDCREKSYWHW